MAFPRLLAVPLFLAALGAASAADDTTPPNARQMLKARLAEEANAPKTTATGAPAPAPRSTTGTPATTSPTTAPSTDKSPILAAPLPSNNTSTTDKKPAENPTVLPKVEVRKGRITELDQQLAKQDELIAREKKNTKSTELDKALNDASVAKPLSIFGGESSQYRKQVASQRVSLMEDEKDLIEAIAHAKTKQEKAELQKQLDALRAERRELEKAMR